MAEHSINEILGWDEEQLKDLRYAGYSYVRNGRYEIARKFFESLFVIDPSSVYDARTLGAIYLQIGEYDLSLKLLNHAKELDDTNDMARNNRSRALFHTGNKEEALKLAHDLAKSQDAIVAQRAEALLILING
ncbi:MAG: type III secretion chaperone [Simkaniaceae bacterium]|nr:type III secretion chaperone [Simkaniaceae bacterium]